jgi:hypothetical protein
MTKRKLFTDRRDYLMAHLDLDAERTWHVYRTEMVGCVVTINRQQHWLSMYLKRGYEGNYLDFKPVKDWYLRKPVASSTLTRCAEDQLLRLQQKAWDSRVSIAKYRQMLAMLKSWGVTTPPANFIMHKFVKS